MSLSEQYVKPTSMMYRNFLAMETEELLRQHPVDGAVQHPERSRWGQQPVGCVPHRDDRLLVRCTQV